MGNPFQSVEPIQPDRQNTIFRFHLDTRYRKLFGGKSLTEKFMRIVFVCLVAATCYAESATAGPDSDAVREFGLFGTWAVDCTKAASQTNPQFLFSENTRGLPVKTLQMGGSKFDGTFEMRDAHVVAQDRLRYTETDSFATYAITLAKFDGRFRSFESTRADGTVLIKDGKFTVSGAPTPLFEKCRSQ